MASPHVLVANRTQGAAMACKGECRLTTSWFCVCAWLICCFLTCLALLMLLQMLGYWCRLLMICCSSDPFLYPKQSNSVCDLCEYFNPFLLYCNECIQTENLKCSQPTERPLLSLQPQWGRPRPVVGIPETAPSPFSLPSCSPPGSQ